MRKGVRIMTKKQNVLKFFLAAVCVFAVFFSLAEPERTAKATFAALSLCARKVVPGVFIFMVAARVLALFGAPRAFSRLTGGAFERVFGVSPGGAAVVFLGLLAGCPSGAAVASELLGRGELEQGECARILPLATAASPAFLLSAVGSLMGVRFGAVMLASQVLSALILLFLTRPRGRAGKPAPVSPAESPRPLAAFTSALKKSGAAALNICSFVTFFCVFSDMVLSLLPARAAGGLFAPLVSGVMEISCGFSRLSACTRSAARYFCGGLMLGFGGFSVLLQSADAAGEGGFCLRKYLLMKTAQALLCGSLAAGIGALADTAAAREALFLFGAETEKVVAVWQTAALFALVYAVLAVQIKIFAKIFKKLWKKSNL
jgi:hypothetical protein